MGICERGKTDILTGPPSTTAGGAHVRTASALPPYRLSALRADQPLRFKTPVFLDAVPNVRGPQHMQHRIARQTRGIGIAAGGVCVDPIASLFVARKVVGDGNGNVVV